MSNLVIDNNVFLLTGNLDMTSNSPYDSSTSENSLIEHTYYIDAQRYEFNVKALTVTDAQYGAFTAILDQVGGHDSVIFDIRSFGGDTLPFTGTISNNLHLQGITLAGATSFTYDHTATNGSGEAPNGLLASGDFIQFSGKPKIYKVTSVNTTTHVYTIFPSLREILADDTEVLYGDDVKPRVKMNKKTFKWSSNVSTPKLRKYSFTLVENPF